MTDGDATTDRPGGVGGGSLAHLADWLLLQVDRKLFTLAILGVVFVSLLAIAWLSPVRLPASMQNSYPVETLFQALVGAIITGVTLVVTITQLIVSQELGPAGDQRERMEGSMAFRDRVEDAVDQTPSPAEPAAFLRALVDSTERQAADVADAVGSAERPLRDDVGSYAEMVSDDARTASQQLADAEFGTYHTVSAGLRYDYSRKIYEAQRLRATYGDELPDAAADALDDLVETLALFGPAREHIKTLYFQWDLANLSRDILYLSIPALIVAVGSVLYLNNPTVVLGTTLGLPNLTVVVVMAATLSVAPFALLLAYVLRITTVAKRTLAIGPFVLGDPPPAEPADD